MHNPPQGGPGVEQRDDGVGKKLLFSEADKTTPNAAKAGWRDVFIYFFNVHIKVYFHREPAGHWRVSREQVATRVLKITKNSLKNAESTKSKNKMIGGFSSSCAFQRRVARPLVPEIDDGRARPRITTNFFSHPCRPTCSTPSTSTVLE